jgi:hypothetical protein
VELPSERSKPMLFSNRNASYQSLVKTIKFQLEQLPSATADNKSEERQASACRRIAIVAAALCLLLANGAMAQNLPGFSAEPYRALAEVSSSQTIPPGTKITPGNWQQYKQFMPLGLQLMYEGRFQWKISNSTDYVVEVGPTTQIPKPKKYAQDTEKFRQTKLVAAGTGGYNIVNYQAGEPFPSPSGPLIGYELLFDNYYQYQPAVLFNHYDEMLSDRYNNHTSLGTIEIQNNLGHVSDMGYPIVRPESQGIFLSIFNEVLSPEQSKYTTQLSILHDDPNLPQDTYVFLPSLRRSLRLSSAARCSPILGTDFINDDNRGFSGLTNLFTATYLGHKKILNLMKMDRDKRHELGNWVIDPNMIGWPKPILGKWELRDTYIFDLRPVQSNNNYCYGDKVMYMDAETQTLSFVDIYDHSRRFWKCFTSFYTSVPIDDGSGSSAALQGDTTSTMFDFQNSHASFAYTSAELAVDHSVPAQYQNAEVYALPSGLDQIMR